MSKTVEKLNQIQVDAHALFIKWHNYHWNIKGMQFYPIHNLTETLYDKMADIFDDAAERAIQLGGAAITCQKQLLEATKISPETKSSFNATDVLNSILSDLTYLKDLYKDLAKVSSDEDDTTTAAQAEEVVADFEKQIWMLKAHLA